MQFIPLNGEWRFALDRTDAGLAERWFGRSLTGRVQLPGSMAAQGLGDPVDGDTPWIGTVFDPSYYTAGDYAAFRSPAPVKVPWWLTPDNAYSGVAWYQRDIEIPLAWVRRRIVLTLERPHWETRAWLGERPLGTQDSLGTPHVYDLGVIDDPGSHRLTLRVDNRIIVNVGENAHSISDHTQGNWNGIIGRIELSVAAPAWIDDLQVYPHAAERAVTVRGVVGGDMEQLGDRKIRLAVALAQSERSGAGSPDVVVETPLEGPSFEATIPLGKDAPLWDEFTPALHTLTVSLPGGETRSVKFGLRDIRVEGRQLSLNGRPLFLRGTLDCALFPATGHPPMDPEPWREILRTLRGHGLNHVRFHSWCPPDAAFVAADELGFYLQVECGAWANTMLPPSITRAATIGDGAPLDAWIYAEGGRILRACGNHPSFLLLAHGNEPGGDSVAPFLGAWVSHFRKAAMGRCLVTAAAGWPEIPESEFLVVPEPRLHAWGAGLKSRLNAGPPATTADYRDLVAKRAVPLVSHEIGQWCAFPQLDDAAKYTGHLRAGNHEIFAAWMAERGLTGQLDSFVHASGRLQVLCYKEEIEAQLRTPGLGGFQLLGLQDFSGQGTAPVGVLDCFWNPKHYATAAEFRRFCAPTVLLARLPRRVFTIGERLTAGLEIAHFGAEPIARAVVWWRLETGDAHLLARGECPPATVLVGNGFVLGEVVVKLEGFSMAQRLRLVAGLAGTEIENDWDLWVYPKAPIAAPAGVHVTRELDSVALEVLDAGGRVALFGGPGRCRGDERGRVELGFTPIFWNTACTQRQAPHTLGILCDPTHPALTGFPTEGHTNWQWWYLVTRADVLILDSLPRELRPLLQVIDDWYSNRRLALAFEARVGAGRLLVCSIDLETGLEGNPAARQLRSSLLDYVAGNDFAPAVALEPGQIAGLFSA